MNVCSCCAGERRFIANDDLICFVCDNRPDAEPDDSSGAPGTPATWLITDMARECFLVTGAWPEDWNPRA